MAPIVIKLNGFRHRKKIAAFDFDWTLVKPNDNKKFPKDVNDWQWLRANVPDILADLYKKGWGLIVFTNQTKMWKVEQIKMVLESLQIPILVCIAMEKAEHKPDTIMWNTAVGLKKWDKEVSFYVGDAMGRKCDWSNTDKLFADAIMVKTVTPEEMFPANLVHETKGVEAVNEQELVIMVGYPGSGKSTLAKDLESNGYVVVSGDDLKTVSKISRGARTHLSTGKSVVIDATNPTKKGRATYITIGTDLGVKVRCIWVKTSMEDSMARNAMREAAVPAICYYVFRKKFEEPTYDEGCKIAIV